MMRIGILGTGRIAHDNVQALLRTDRVEITALCNRTREKVEGFAATYDLDAPIYTDYHKMLRETKLDAVLLNTPHDQHCEQFLACAEHGLHVLVEKPLATTLADGKRMLAAQHERGIRAAVCHTQRYLAPMMTLRDFLCGPDMSALGPIRHIIDTLNFAYFHKERPCWYFDEAAAGGGMLLTHGAHQIDRIHVLLGKCTDSVHAHLEYGSTMPGIDTGYQILGIAGESSYVVSCGGYPGVHTSTLQLTCEGGTLRLSLFSTGLEGVGVYMGSDGEPFSALPIQYAETDTYLRQFEDMLDAVEDKSNSAPLLEDALAVLDVLERCRMK